MTDPILKMEISFIFNSYALSGFSKIPQLFLLIRCDSGLNWQFEIQKFKTQKFEIQRLGNSLMIHGIWLFNVIWKIQMFGLSLYSIRMY